MTVWEEAALFHLGHIAWFKQIIQASICSLNQHSNNEYYSITQTQVIIEWLQVLKNFVLFLYLSVCPFVCSFLWLLLWHEQVYCFCQLKTLLLYFLWKYAFDHYRCFHVSFQHSMLEPPTLLHFARHQYKQLCTSLKCHFGTVVFFKQLINWIKKILRYW